jgi:hypothetical protein
MQFVRHILYMFAFPYLYSSSPREYCEYPSDFYFLHDSLSLIAGVTLLI